MERDEARPGVDREQERGDVAEAEHDLRIAADHLEVEIGQQAAAAPPAANRQDAADRGIAKRAVDVRGAVAILPRKVAVTIQQVSGYTDPEPERLQRLPGDFEVHRLEGGAGGSHERHLASRLEPPGSHDRPLLGSARRQAGRCQRSGGRGGSGCKKSPAMHALIVRSNNRPRRRIAFADAPGRRT
ncbi:MAG TPA: hypothetical protein VFO14_04055 [Vicinamibacterales bacterium]|nr:hypothetical protein [Vicinamibacterales bacterium]